MKSKTLLFRTLAFSLYPSLGSNCFLPSSPGTLVLKTGELAKRLRISVGRMKEQLHDLEALGFIYDLHVDKYVSTYKVKSPEVFGGVIHHAPGGTPVPAEHPEVKPRG